MNRESLKVINLKLLLCSAAPFKPPNFKTHTAAPIHTSFLTAFTWNSSASPNLYPTYQLYWKDVLLLSFSSILFGCGF